MNLTLEEAAFGGDHCPDGVLLQPLWEYMTARRELIVSPYLPAFFAFLMHVLLCTPFLALEALGSFWPRINLLKIANNSDPQSLRRWFDCFCRILLKYFTTILPATALFQSFTRPRCPELAPSCSQLFLEVVACLLLFDMLFFALHYSVHRVPWLYHWVHQAHHQNRVPFALAAQDASAAELLSLLILALTSARVVGCHPLSEALFHLTNSWLAVEDHCGFDLPWALHRLLPFMGGAPFHQAHHHLYRGNYAPYFTHWDWLCGTYITQEAGGR